MSVKPEPPAVPLDGESEVIDGTGLGILKLILCEGVVLKDTVPMLIGKVTIGISISYSRNATEIPNVPFGVSESVRVLFNVSEIFVTVRVVPFTVTGTVPLLELMFPKFVLRWSPCITFVQLAVSETPTSALNTSGTPIGTSIIG